MLKKLPNITLITFGAISLVVIVMFMLGLGNDTFVSPNSGEALTNSTHTDLFLNWTYILFGIALLVFVVSFLLWIGAIFAQDKTRGFTLVGSIVVLGLLMLVSWFLGSGEKMNIIGYEGADNEGFWCQWSDMILYTAYTMIAVVILSLLATVVYRRLKK